MTEENDNIPSPDDSTATQLQRDNDRLTQLEKRLGAMDAEYELFDALMRDRCANLSTFEHMLTSRQALEELRDANQQTLTKLRMLEMTPPEDEGLLHEIMGE